MSIAEVMFTGFPDSFEIYGQYVVDI